MVMETLIGWINDLKPASYMKQGLSNVGSNKSSIVQQQLLFRPHNLNSRSHTS